MISTRIAPGADRQPLIRMIRGVTWDDLVGLAGLAAPLKDDPARIIPT